MKNAYVEGELDESCGDDASQIVSVYGRSRTLVFGDLPAGTREASLALQSGVSRSLRLLSDPSGRPRQFYVTSLATGDPGPFKVTGRNDAGGTTARQDATLRAR